MASASITIKPEIGLQAISAYLEAPIEAGKIRYIEFNGLKMEMKTSIPASAHKLRLISVDLDNNITIQCLSDQEEVIKKLYKNRMHSNSINDSLHPNDLQAKSDIASRCHLILEDPLTLEDLPEMATMLGFVTVEELAEDGMPIPNDTTTPKLPFHKKISQGFKKMFPSSKKNETPPQTASISARLAQDGTFGSGDSGISRSSLTSASAEAPAAMPAPAPAEPVVVHHTPSEASRAAVRRLEENFGLFTRLLPALEHTRAQLIATKETLTQLRSELNHFSTDIFENTDVDRMLDEKKLGSSDLLHEINVLEQQLVDIEERKNELQVLFRQEVGALSHNEEFQRDFGNDESVTTLLARLERIGNEEGIPFPRDSVQGKNPLEIIQEKGSEITQSLNSISDDLSAKTAEKDPKGLLFSWNIQTNSFEVESKFTLFGTAKVFVPINDDGTGIYCKEDSEREIKQLIEVIRTNGTQKKGAIRHAKDNLYKTMQKFARNP